MVKRIKIGTRGSALALWQTNWVKSKLESIFRHCSFDIVNIKTQGDRASNVPLESIGGEGVFVKQIEIALLNGEIDLAVHSMKDVPTTLPDGLTIGAIPERADPADVLILKSEANPRVSQSPSLPVSLSPCLPSPLSLLSQGAKVGTGSLRRRSQLLHLRSDLVIRDIRGNVDTRLKKLRAGDLDAIVLAAAGLERLGVKETPGLFVQRLPYNICLPAVGQGALCIEIRAEDSDLHNIVKSIDYPESAAAVMAERAFLRKLGGGCRVPIAALGKVDSGKLSLTGLVADRNGRKVIRSEISGKQDQAENIGERLAELLLDMGAGAVLSS